MAVTKSCLFLVLVLVGLAQGQTSSFSAFPQQQDFGTRTQRQSFGQQQQSSGRSFQQPAFGSNSFQQQPKSSFGPFGQQAPKSSFGSFQQQPQQQRSSSNFGSSGQQQQKSSFNSFQQQPQQQRTSSNFGQQQQKSSFGSFQQPQQQRTSSNFGSFGQQQQKSSFGSFGQSQQKSNFGSSQQQSGFGSFNQQQPKTKPTGSCPDKNARYPKSSQCDAYIECLDGVYDEKLCPDGLLFNPNVTFNVYPCQYPADVDCAGRGSTQPAQPTENCPHQFGYYRAGGSPSECGGFISCVDGRSFDFSCPEGLAWSPATYRCEWPDEVPECDAEAFLGFRCPEVPISRELGPPAGFRSYKSNRDCQQYFICLNDKPRLLHCGAGQAFDEETSLCEDLENIVSCPQELRNQAAASRSAKKSKF